jgi:hypothetical protein
MAVNRFLSSVTRIFVRDHIILRRPVAGEDDQCSGEIASKAPKTFSPQRMLEDENAAATRQWL